MQLSEEEVNGGVAEAIHLAGIVGYEQNAPYHLSYGEKKRVAIAGVLAMQTLILLFDESTAKTSDPQNKKGVINVLHSMRGALLIATHDLSTTFEFTNRVLILKWTKHQNVIQERFRRDCRSGLD